MFTPDRRETDHYRAQIFSPGRVVSEVPYIPPPEDFRYMGMAIKEARRAATSNEVAVGAVLVVGKGRDRQIYKGHSTELSARHLMQHAETNAYIQAQPEVGLDLSPTN